MTTATNPSQSALLAVDVGQVPGNGMPDWPSWCTTFNERKAYQQGIADARALLNKHEGIEDLFTHRQSWRSALIEARDNAKASDDSDDGSYWEHEIRVFDRCFDTLTTVLPATERQL